MVKPSRVAGPLIALFLSQPAVLLANDHGASQATPEDEKCRLAPDRSPSPTLPRRGRGQSSCAYFQSKDHGASQATPAAPPLTVPSPFEQRLLQGSRRFIGKGYRLSPLGEAGGIDPDPLFRQDLFDCTTYIETVIALARDPADPRSEMRKIRYRDGQVDFSHRRHLPEFQWLSGLAETGVLRDITRDIAPGEARLLPVAMTPSLWAGRNRGILPGLKASAVPTRRLDLPYIPLADFPRIAREIEGVAVLSVVRRQPAGLPVHVSHQVLLIPQGKGALIRHARPRPVNRVIEEDLARFLARLQRQGRRPVLGLNVADILDPAEPPPLPRISGLSLPRH